MRPRADCAVDSFARFAGLRRNVLGCSPGLRPGLSSVARVRGLEGDVYKRQGEQRMLQLVAKYGMTQLNLLVEALLDYAERLVRAELRSLPAGEFTAEDFMDSDGVTDEPLKIAVRLRTDPNAGALEVDFRCV